MAFSQPGQFQPLFGASSPVGFTPARCARLAPRSAVPIRILQSDGKHEVLITTAAIETSLEVSTLQSGIILPMILARIAGS